MCGRGPWRRMLSTTGGDHEVSVEGVRSSLGTLCDSEGGGETAHSIAGEAAGIIGWLEVRDSDVAHNLAEMRTRVSSRSSASRCQRLLADGASHREAKVLMSLKKRCRF